MVTELAKITARGQTTIPKRIRTEAGLSEGDVVAFLVEGDHVTIRKLVREEDGYLRGVSDTMGEWTTYEDESAWRDL